MRVYDVVSAKNQLDEAYEVVPRGKPPNKMFVVVDPESGKELGDYKTPGQARDAAKDANAKVQAAADKRKADAEQAEKDKADKIKKRDRLYRYLKISAGSLYALVSVYGIKKNIDKHIEEQVAVYDAYVAGEYGKVGSPEAIKKYEDRSKMIYGAFVTQSVSTILASGIHAAVAAKLVSGIKAARNAGMVVGGSASLGIGALISFILGEAASYAVIWLINKPSTIEALIKYTWNAPGLAHAFIFASDFSPSVGLDPDIQKNLQQALEMDKRKQAGDDAAAKNFTAPKPAPAPAPAPAASDPQASSSGGAPAAASGNWAASFLD